MCLNVSECVLNPFVNLKQKKKMEILPDGNHAMKRERDRERQRARTQ
jgi:hypothetical protein